jgi:hypothetical protein
MVKKTNLMSARNTHPSRDGKNDESFWNRRKIAPEQLVKYIEDKLNVRIY